MSAASQSQLAVENVTVSADQLVAPSTHLAVPVGQLQEEDRRGLVRMLQMYRFHIILRGIVSVVHWQVGKQHTGCTLAVIQAATSLGRKCLMY